MTRNSAIAATLLMLGSASLAACGDDDGDETPDGGQDAHVPHHPSNMDGSVDDDDDQGGGGDASTMDAAPPPFVPPTMQPDVSCGGTDCSPLTMQEVSAGFSNCCTDDDVCGVKTALTGDACLEPSAAGGADPSCPNLSMEGSMGAGGCCTADDECGALIGGSGCVSNALLGQPESSCTYDPDNTCTRIFEVTCDGAEDCPGEQICCGQYSSGYRRTFCADSCTALIEQEGGSWAQFCHPGDTCIDEGDEGYTCLASAQFLPDDLARCRTSGTPLARPRNTEAGKINCGLTEEDENGIIRRQVCGAGEKCCVSYPGEISQCVPEDDGCPCGTIDSTEPDAGVGDDEDAG